MMLLKSLTADITPLAQWHCGADKLQPAISDGDDLVLKGIGRCAYAEFSLFIQRGHAIHGSYDKHLGKPVSHGCVRLYPGNAAKLFSLVESKGPYEH